MNAKPTLLLYKKTAGGYELEGVIFTAQKRSDEKDLHKQIPLSVAQWHTHVNIYLLAKLNAQTSGWMKFGPNGSILAEGECEGMKDRWAPQFFGWMIHAYPFKDSDEKILAH